MRLSALSKARYEGIVQVVDGCRKATNKGSNPFALTIGSFEPKERIATFL